MHIASPTDVAVGDVDGDGTPDAALPYFDNAPGSVGGVAVLLNNGDGVLTASVHLTAGTNPTAVTVADINGDGKTDLVVGNLGSGQCPGSCLSGSASILLNMGDGRFAQGGGFATSIDYVLPSSLSPALVHSVALGDLNADGDLDMVVASDGGLAVYLSAPH
jgi:hypothetical protein